MAYIENPFSVGQSVVCVNEHFTMVITTADKERIGALPPIHPKVNEMLAVDEILGEYLRFDQYDCDDVNHPDYGWRWWKHTHFTAIQEYSSSDEHMNQNLSPTGEPCTPQEQADFNRIARIIAPVPFVSD